MFDPAAVERERGVVLAEQGATTDVDGLVDDRVDAFHGPALRSVQRPVIGDLPVLRAITPAALAGFHARWYRPEKAVLVAVGELSPDELAGLERELAAAFADWRGQGPATPRPPLRGPDPSRGLDAFVMTEPRVAGGLSVCRLQGAAPTTLATLADFRRRALRLVWLAALQARLDQLGLADPAVQWAEVVVEDDEPDVMKVCLNAGAAAADWRAALTALHLEARRFTTDGPSEQELEAAMTEVRGGFVGDVSKAATRASADLASALAYRELIGQASQEPRQTLKAFNQAVEAITPQEVVEAWRRDWAGPGPLVAVVSGQPPTREEVLAAWTQNEAAKTQAYVKREVPRWAYGGFGPPGKVVRREVFADPDFVRLRFRNGLVLNFKQTAFAKGQIEVRVDVGGGREALGTRSVHEGFLATDAFITGGLGRHSYSDLKAMFGEEPLNFEFTMRNRAFTLSSSAFPDRLAQQLLLMAAYLSDPGFHEDLDAKLLQFVADDYRTRAAAPAAVIIDRLEAMTSRPAPPIADLARLDSRAFAAWLRPIVTTAPIEATLVGDIDEASAIALVAETLGALPERAAAPPSPAYRGYGRFPSQTASRVALSHAGPADKAVVTAIWPLFVAEPARRREEYALELLAAVFDDELRHAVRERLGKVYAPSVQLEAPDRADQGYLMASVEAAPADLAAVEGEARALAARLARGEISAAALEAARKPLQTRAGLDMADNAWWALHLAGSARDPQRARDLVEAPRILAALTLDEVKRAAADWLSGPPLVLLATPETRK